MNDKYEKDGIIYFKTPFEVDYSDWLAKHLDCDSIIKSIDGDIVLFTPGTVREPAAAAFLNQ